MWEWQLDSWSTPWPGDYVKEREAEGSPWEVGRIGEDFHHHLGWLMWIPLNKVQDHDWRLHLCLVRAAEDGHNPKLPLTYPICDEDSHWCDLLPFLLEQVMMLTPAWAHTLGGTSLIKSPSDTTQKQKACKQGSSSTDIHSSAGNDGTKQGCARRSSWHSAIFS